MKNKTLIFRWLQILLISIPYCVSFYPYYGEAILLLLGISFALGFVTWLGINLAIDPFHRWEEARLIKAALEGNQSGVDGKRIAVLGKIYPLAEPITAPFSGQECLIVGYDIFHQYFKRTLEGKNIHSNPIIYSGYHMAPSEIRGRTEKVRILRFPDISEVPENETTSYGMNRPFIEKTAFTPRFKGSFIEGVNELSRVIPLDENGAAAEDYQFRELIPEQTIKSREQVVKKGADICLIGVYNAAQKGIESSRSRFGRSMRLIPGTGKSISASLKKDSGIVLIFGFVVFMLCISAGIFPHTPDTLLQQLPVSDKLIAFRNKAFPRQVTVPHTVTKKQKKTSTRPVNKEQVQPDIENETLKLIDLIQQGDVDSLKKELEEGLDPNMHIISGDNFSLPLVEAIIENQIEVARLLLDFGADINALNSYNVNGLDAAVSASNVEAVTFLLDAGAEILSGHAHGISPLNRAILNQDVEIVTLLLEAGADPLSPEIDLYLPYLPAEGDKADKIRELIENARGKND